MSTQTTRSRAALILSNPIPGWQGTYALTVAFAAKDLLSDDEPVRDVTVQYEHTSATPFQVVEQTGTLVDANDTELILETEAYGTVRIEISDVRHFEVEG